ncbi:DUF3291 domain-containing protein [Larkinella rosea]|uniref:DUF3291 domain-containing protein n=1 Tax=Larkinella rosea TaxID=2025312 RepID=A0A3P1BTR7_9BACT|nr:DUF3291 domain-containing protein [Larkinella rosea]RRB04491.1 DUF3291 domain-containing protein [Larkinella rosea]
MVVTFTLLRYPPRRWYRAFANMGRWVMNPFQAEGLRFQKMMGCGRNFGLIPDLSAYVFLGVWTDEKNARLFFESDRWKNICTETNETGTLYLNPIRSHGAWDGQNPFETAASPRSGGFPVAVLTRATIRLAALPDFWRHIPQVRQRLKTHADDLLLAIGVGEKPVLQQCTISVWKDEKVIEQFAYRQSGHKEVVRRTRERRWYSEELFARFQVVGREGTFNGKPLFLETETTPTAPA